MKSKLLFSVGLIAVLAASSSASTILIDFGSAVTTGQPETWNNFNGVADNSSIPNLKDTTSAETGYVITLSGGAVDSNPLNSTTPANIYNPFTPETVLSDFIVTNSARTLTLSGLNPGVLYDLTFYAYAGSRSTTRETSFTISGYSPLLLEPSWESVNPRGGQVGTISNVSPDGTSINITVDLTPFNASENGSPNWILSGMAINYTIPEPSFVFLSTLGFIPFLRRRR